MPLYQYRNCITGKIEEIFKRIADRDDVPGHLTRITVPQTVGYANSSHLREPGADEAVPKAFRQYEEQGASVRQIERETGFSRDHIRKIWNFLLIGLLLLGLNANAADINKGYSFTPTDRVTNTKLNNLVDQATINPSFLSDKTAAQPLSSDSFLFYQASSGLFRKATLDALNLSNTNLIIGQIEDDMPATNDFLLTFDTSAGSYKKVPFNAIWTNADFVFSRTNWSTPNIFSTYFLAYDGGAWAKVTRSNLFYQYGQFAYITDLTVHGAPTNADYFMVYDTFANINKRLTLAGMITNAPTVSSALTNGDLILGYSTNTTNFAQFRLSQIRDYVTNNSPTLALTNHIPVTFVSAEVAVPGAGGTTINTNHGFVAAPQMVRAVLVCKTADANYAVGDEVDVHGSDQGSDVNFNVGANATNVFLVTRQVATIRVINKTASGGLASIVNGSWKLKIYATYFP